MHTDSEVREPETRLHLPAFPEFSCNWFAAYTSSRHEKRVASQLKERHVESFCPLYSARHRWKNRAESDVRLPLFPNYVFVQIEPRERRRVLEVPGVLSLVSFGRKLAALPTREVEALRSSVGQMTIEPHPYLVIGERVRITTGAMVGIEGVLVRKKNHVRVVIALNALMRGVAVEVDECDLEPAGEFRA